MLISNSGIQDAQIVYVLASASPMDNEMNAESTNDQSLNAITYESIS